MERKNVNYMAFLVTFLPMLGITIALAILSVLAFGFPWPLGFGFGMLMNGHTPVPVYSVLAKMRGESRGGKKGIPNTLSVATTIEDALTPFFFNICIYFIWD